jgi:flagellar hook assembly protein FlgD
MKAFILTLLICMTYVSYAQSDYLIVRLKSGDADTIKVSEISSIKFESATSVTETQSNISNTKNFPNPFSESTTIEFDLENSVSVEVVIYNNTGNKIRTLSCNDCSAGKNYIDWDTKNQKGDVVPSGVYIYEIHSSNVILSKQIIKVK